IASGYVEGSIRIWNSEKGICETTLNGHEEAVTTIHYNKLGSLLASGSKYNGVILWDVVTDVVFLGSGKKLVTASKDKFLRTWDLDTQHCMHIISGHHTKIWSIDIDPEERYLRQRKDRVATMRFNKSGNLFACQVAGKTVEIFRVLDESESKRIAKIRISIKEKKYAKESREATEKGET
ncbi:hypothetical protein H5410_045503, partial [Solanum commersonii]